MGWGGSVHCTRYAGAFRLAFDQYSDVSLLEMLTAQEQSLGFASFCKHQAGKIECLTVCLVQQKTLQALQDSVAK